MPLPYREVSAPPQPEYAKPAGGRRNASFLVKREPPDPEHELYCQWLARQFYRDLIDDMIAGGFLSAERAAELLGVEDTP